MINHLKKGSSILEKQGAAKIIIFF